MQQAEAEAEAEEGLNPSITVNLTKGDPVEEAAVDQADQGLLVIQDLLVIQVA